jgi:hypothetical protein
MRNPWSSLNAHLKAHLVRFLRLFVVAVAGQLAVLSVPLTTSVLVAALIAGAESALHQAFPMLQPPKSSPK